MPVSSVRAASEDAHSAYLNGIDFNGHYSWSVEGGQAEEKLLWEDANLDRLRRLKAEVERLDLIEDEVTGRLHGLTPTGSFYITTDLGAQAARAHHAGARVRICLMGKVTYDNTSCQPVR